MGEYDCRTCGLPIQYAEEAPTGVRVECEEGHSYVISNRELEGV